MTSREIYLALRADVQKMNIGDTEKQRFILQIDAILNGQSFAEANRLIPDQKECWRRIGLGRVTTAVIQ